MATTLTMRLANLAHFLTAASKVPAEHVTYDPTASGMTATDVQAAIDELEAGGGGGGSQFTEDATNDTYRFPAGFHNIGQENGNGTEDGYLSLANGTDPGAEIGVFDATASGAVGVFITGGVAGAYINAEVISLAVQATLANSKHKLTGGHGLVVPHLASDPSGGNSEAGQIYYNTSSNTFRGFDGSVWGELALT